MVAVAWLPQVILLAGLVLGAQDPAGYFADTWLEVPRFLLSGALLAIYVATLASLAASFTTRRAYASAFFVGLFVVSAAVIGSVTESIDVHTGRWLALLSIRDVPLFLNDLIFGGPSTAGASAAEHLPGSVQVAWYVLVVGVAGFVTWLRYRRLAA
jgi:hypothetical protein